MLYQYFLEQSEIGRETDMTLPLNIISKKDRPEKTVENTYVPFSGHQDDDDFDVSLWFFILFFNEFLQAKWRREQS